VRDNSFKVYFKTLINRLPVLIDQKSKPFNLLIKEKRNCIYYIITVSVISISKETNSAQY